MGKLTKVLGTGLGLAVAAVAGAYLVYRKNPKFRKSTNLWAERMKREISKTLGGLKDVNKATFQEVVDSVSERYGRLKDVNQEELKGLVSDLKESWTHFNKELSGLKK